MTNLQLSLSLATIIITMAPRKLTQLQYDAMISPKNKDSIFTALTFKAARAALSDKFHYKGQTFTKRGSTTHLRTVLILNNGNAKKDQYDGSIVFISTKFPYYFMHDENGTYINGSESCSGLVYQGPLVFNEATGEGTSWWLESSDVWKNDAISVGDVLGVSFASACCLLLALACCCSLLLLVVACCCLLLLVVPSLWVPRLLVPGCLPLATCYRLEASYASNSFSSDSIA